jgi:hypothetical protein
VCASAGPSNTERRKIHVANRELDISRKIEALMSYLPLFKNEKLGLQYHNFAAFLSAFQIVNQLAD